MSGRTGTEAKKLTNEILMKITKEKKLKRSLAVQLCRKQSILTNLTNKPLQNLCQLDKISGSSLIIDISSDEENQRHSTPIETPPLNIV